MLDIEGFLNCGTIFSSTPGKVHVAWGKRDWREVPDLNFPACFYFPDFFLKIKSPWFVQENFEEMEISTLFHLLAPYSKEDHFPTLDWVPRSKDLFSSSFHGLKALFEKSELQKGVPFIFYESQATLLPPKLAFLLKNAIQYTMRSPVCIYGFWDRSQGMLGASPEILFRHMHERDKGTVETIALAGTCLPKHSDAMLNDPKLSSEHLLVVQGIVESLSPFGRVTQGIPRVLSLPKLSHLMTEITLFLRAPVQFEAIVRALHPTPALGAFPRQAGMQWLKELQDKIDRRRYGAPVGMRLKNSNSKTIVAIRNLQWQDETLKIGAGCGIVHGSSEEREWDEIELKFSAIKSILGL